MATETTERARQPAVDAVDLQAIARRHRWTHVERLRDIEIVGDVRGAAIASGALTAQGGEALRAAATAGGVVPTPLDGRALVLAVIGRARARVKGRPAGGSRLRAEVSKEVTT